MNLYSYADDIGALRSASIIYYRIRQVDIDGKASYSTIALIKSNSGGFDVHPTLFKTSFNLQINEAGALQLELYTMDGRLLQRQTVQQGVNTITLKNNYSGLLIYKLIKNEELLATGKLIKH